MRPVEQTIFGDKGNCLAACIASVFECGIDEVPARGGGAIDQGLMDWLAERNLALHSEPIRGHKEDGSAMVCFPGYSILIAKSPRTEGFHAVVVRDGRIEWDPHPEREQGVCEWSYFFLFRVLDPVKPVLFPSPGIW